MNLPITVIFVGWISGYSKTIAREDQRQLLLSGLLCARANAFDSIAD